MTTNQQAPVTVERTSDLLLLRALLCLSGFAGEGLSVTGFDDPLDLYGDIAHAIGMEDCNDDSLRAHIAIERERQPEHRPTTPAPDVAAAVAAEREAIIARLIELTPAPAGGPFSHTNSMRVVMQDAIAAIRARTGTPDASSEGMVWKPIETAPKDGQSILAICGDAYSPRATVTWWQDGWTYYSRPEDKWHGGVCKWFPTDWMDLPAMLAASEQGERDNG